MQAKPEKIVGYATMIDGTHVPLLESEAASIWASVEAAREDRKRSMPDSASALDALQSALTRLNELGWRQGCYCPKDGSEFAVMQFGSTGIFSAFYSGKWPDGHVISCDCAINPAGLLWKSLAHLTQPERAKLAQCTEADRVMHEREIRAFSALSEPSPSNRGDTP